MNEVPSENSCEYGGVVCRFVGIAHGPSENCPRDNILNISYENYASKRAQVSKLFYYSIIIYTIANSIKKISIFLEKCHNFDMQSCHSKLSEVKRKYCNIVTNLYKL